MLFIGFLIQKAKSTRTISSVLCGNWTMESIFSTDHQERENLTFVIQPGAGSNWLVTNIKGNIMQINLSSEDLSGNITYEDIIYDFNLTQIAPPFVASEVDLGNEGIAHCSFASYGLMQCTHLNKKGLVVIYLFKKHELIYNDSWLKRNWQRILLSSAFVLIPLITKYAQQRMIQKESYRRYLEQQKEKKENDEKQKLVEGKKENDENNNDQQKLAEEKKENDENQNERKTVNEQEKDKLKTE